MRITNRGEANYCSAGLMSPWAFSGATRKSAPLIPALIAACCFEIFGTEFSIKYNLYELSWQSVMDLRQDPQTIRRKLFGPQGDQ
jgi:hypothetical protein